jgi:hypothetical protein
MTLPRLTAIASGVLVALLVGAGCASEADAPPGAGEGVDSGATGTAEDAAMHAPPVAPPVDAGILVVIKRDASGEPADGGSCAAVEQAAEALPSSVADIIWIIDNSGSMSFEAKSVQDNLNVFSRLISGGGVDARVVLISMGASSTAGSGTGMCILPPLGSGKCPDDTSYPRLFHVPEMVNSNDELTKIMSTYDKWRGVLRKGVAKTFVVVTDDNSRTSASTFVTWVNSQAEFQGALWRFSGIFCPGTGGADCAAQGKVYNDLVLTTSGVVGDLSRQDFSPIFQQLASSVVKDAIPVDCQWTIPTPTGGAKLDPNAVNVRFTQEDGVTETLLGVIDAAECDDVHGGWYYDDAVNPTRVVACESSCRVMQSDHHARVEVAFGCTRKLRKLIQ